MYTIPAPVLLTQTLLDTSALIRVLLNNTISDLGLTEAQWRVISYINRSQGLTQTQLALLLGIAKAPLGEHLDALEGKQLLRRESDDRDKRVKRLFLTPAGQALAKVLVQRFNELSSRYDLGAYAGTMAAMQAELVSLSDLVAEADTRAALARLEMPNNLHLLGVLARLLAKKVRAELADHKLTTTQWRILAKLLDNPQLQQKDLVLELNIAKAPLGKIIGRLEIEGWLTRRVCAQDRRAYTLHITDEGRRRMRAFYADLAVRLIPLDDFALNKTEQLLSDLRALQRLLHEIQEP